jgi:phosphatidylglycerophosphate synthase
VDSRAHDQWSQAHGGIDPHASAWVAGWVRLTHRCAAPLARRGVSPDVVTMTGLGLSVPVPVLAGLPGAWPLASTLLLVVAALVDGLDGAVAAQQGSATAWGAVLDPLADRCSDLLALLALVVLGAPVWLCVAVGAMTLLHESVRSSARAAGLEGIGALTVWERPSRVIVASFATGLAGLLWCARELGLSWWPGLDRAGVATGGAVVGAVLAVAGFVHLTVAVRRRLGGVGSGGPDQPGDDPGGQQHQRQPTTGVRRSADQEQPRDR